MVTEKTVTISDPGGLHARPAARFVEVARCFQAEITVERMSGPSANAKSIMSLLALGAENGTTVTIRADGPDAEEAVAVLSALLVKESNEGGPR